jgi:hypothetical protein
MFSNFISPVSISCRTVPININGANGARTTERVAMDVAVNINNNGNQFFLKFFLTIA